MYKILPALLLCLLPLSAQAFRCGNDLIKKGDTKATVEKHCGAADATDSYTRAEKTVVYDGDKKTVSTADVDVEVWTYDRAQHGVTYTLQFEFGKLKKISSARN